MLPVIALGIAVGLGVIGCYPKQFQIDELQPDSDMKGNPDMGSSDLAVVTDMADDTLSAAADYFSYQKKCEGLAVNLALMETTSQKPACGVSQSSKIVKGTTSSSLLFRNFYAPFQSYRDLLKTDQCAVQCEWTEQLKRESGLLLDVLCRGGLILQLSDKAPQTIKVRDLTPYSDYQTLFKLASGQDCNIQTIQ